MTNHGIDVSTALWPQQYGVPSWFVEARFGLFIPWGLYSVSSRDVEFYSRDDALPHADPVAATR
jgi:hypothetical protein